MKTVLAVLILLALPLNSANAKVFNFIYVEAGEGNSSAGHVAIGFGQEIYHYQYENAYLRLFKQKARSFRNHYQFLQNRTIHVADVEVSNETYERLHRHFKVRFLEQNQKLKYLDALLQNQAMLQALLTAKGEHASNISDTPELSMRLLGAGLFYNDENSVSLKDMAVECNTITSSAQTLSTVKQAIEERFGKLFLSSRIKTLKNQLETLTPQSENAEDFTQYPFSERYNDMLNELLALRITQNYQPLARNACFTFNSPEQHLSESQRQNLQAHQRLLLASIPSLIESKRPDKGYALFVTMARLIAIEQSILSRHWVFIDDTKEAAITIPQNQLMLYANQMQRERRNDLKHFQEAVADLNFGMDGYSQHYMVAEMAANRLHQWQLSDKTKYLRYHSEQTLPTKSISIKRFLVSDLPISSLKLALTKQAQTANRLMAEDDARNTYHLLTHNCVSALFEQINQAVSPEQSGQRLGGYVDPKVNIIPFQAFATVENTYHIGKVHKLPSYREQKLAEISGKEDYPLVYLRESNIFSSSIYRYNPDDAWFVFFTDDATLLRPFFGTVNMVSAATQSVFGLVTWPFDQGKQLKLGAKGLVASLPELAFFNIRKGSYPYILRH